MITDKPMPEMAAYISNNTEYGHEKHHSYGRLYKQISILALNDYTPELTYFEEKANATGILKSVNFTDIGLNMDDTKLFNGGMWGDLWLNLNKTEEDNFNTPAFKKYLRYTIIQGGLFGMFTEKTPKQLVEGYIDPLIGSMSLNPVYMGGDQTTSPFLSIAYAPTNP